MWRSLSNVWALNSSGHCEPEDGSECPYRYNSNYCFRKCNPKGKEAIEIEVSPPKKKAKKETKAVKKEAKDAKKEKKDSNGAAAQGGNKCKSKHFTSKQRVAELTLRCVALEQALKDNDIAVPGEPSSDTSETDGE